MLKIPLFACEMLLLLSNYVRDSETVVGCVRIRLLSPEGLACFQYSAFSPPAPLHPLYIPFARNNLHHSCSSFITRDGASYGQNNSASPTLLLD